MAFLKAIAALETYNFTQAASFYVHITCIVHAVF